MTTPQSQVVGWRILGDTEIATHPEARLGGPLAVIFWGAAIMVALFVLVVGWLIAFGSFYTTAMLSQMMFSGASLTSIVTGISMIPQATFFVWACVFVVMTMGCRPSTPTVTSVMIVIWALTSIGAQVATRYVIAQNSFVPSSLATLLPYVLLEIVMVAAFCGYMSDGHRPNVYFLRRVRA